jgi:hypothetical protein
MTKREKMQRALELLSEAAKLLDQIGGPDAELLSEQVSECLGAFFLVSRLEDAHRLHEHQHQHHDKRCKNKKAAQMLFFLLGHSQGLPAGQGLLGPRRRQP